MILGYGGKIDPELHDIKGRTALEIAIDKRDYKMVQKVQSYMVGAGIVCNHQAYVDSASSILVGAALLVTVTFAAWVQIPNNDSTLFWVFISLSFYFAVATFITAAGAVIPSKDSTLSFLRRGVLLSAFCLAISLAGAVAAFATAGFLTLPPGKSHRKVIATTVVGGFVCLFCLLSFLRKILKSLGLLFVILDYAAQQKLEKYTVNAVKMMLGKPLLDTLENRYKAWYKAWYTDPVDEFFKTEDEDSNKVHYSPSITSGHSLV
jgi:hypothetical protein